MIDECKPRMFIYSPKEYKGAFTCDWSLNEYYRFLPTHNKQCYECPGRNVTVEWSLGSCF